MLVVVIHKLCLLKMAQSLNTSFTHFDILYLCILNVSIYHKGQEPDLNNGYWFVTSECFSIFVYSYVIDKYSTEYYMQIV